MYLETLELSKSPSLKQLSTRPLKPQPWYCICTELETCYPNPRSLKLEHLILRPYTSSLLGGLPFPHAISFGHLVLDCTNYI